MVRHWLLIVSFAFLFGLGQQGVVLHAISHFADETQSESKQGKKSHHSSFCDKCMVYAALGSAAQVDVPVLVLVEAGSIMIAGDTRHFRSVQKLTYQARAPPLLA